MSRLGKFQNFEQEMLNKKILALQFKALLKIVRDSDFKL